MTTTMYSNLIEKVPLKKFVSDWMKDKNNSGYIRLYVKDGKMVVFRNIEHRHKTGTIISYEMTELDYIGIRDQSHIFHLHFSDGFNFMNMLAIHAQQKDTSLSISYYPNDVSEMLEKKELGHEFLYITVMNNKKGTTVTMFSANKVYENHLQMIAREYQEPPIPTNVAQYDEVAA